jgi:RNA polymerase sigma-70 factor (ECF subfamily)
MFDTIVSGDDEEQVREKEATIEENEYTTLMQNLERLLASARPRLTRLAHVYGVTPDGVEDVVQETLVNAWQHLAYLRSPDRFEAWLNGICRNMSMRWTYAQEATDRHLQPFSSLQATQENTRDDSMFDIPDTQALDIAEELNRQDIAVLLDRAMSHLPATTRKALELYYLADLPQREVALQLGMTSNAVEVKLHRARRQLRQVLQNQLRDDAASFGLPLDQETEDQRWRDTSIWCCICGYQRLQGLFESQPDGEVTLRLRCPTCSSVSGSDLINTAHMMSFANVRSFRPAFKHVLHTVSSISWQALTAGRQPCITCGQPASLLGVEPEVLPAPFYTRLSIVYECPTCGRSSSSIISLCLTYPPVAQFVMQHERCIIEPEELIEYHEQPAIRASIYDLLSARRLTIILHRSTYQLLAVFQT